MKNSKSMSDAKMRKLTIILLVWADIILFKPVLVDWI